MPPAQMTAGRLRHRIEIRTATTERTQGAGFVESPSTLATVWAYVEPTTGSELLEAQQVAGRATYIVVIRYGPEISTISPLMTILLSDGRVLNILNVRKLEEINTWYELLCVEDISK